MTMQEVLKKVAKAGYSEALFISPEGVSEELEHALLDPEFWKALGKSLDWGNPTKGFALDDWRSHWHEFIDHLINGGTIEEYFANLN